MVSPRWLVLWVALACTRPPTSAQLVSEARTGLAEREAKVHSYRFDAEMTGPGQHGTWSVAYRGPGSYRADTPSVSYLLDGDKFFEIDHATGKVQPSTLSQTDRNRSLERVYSAFAPFIPEGWRSPLIGSAVTAIEGPQQEREKTVLLSVGAHLANEQAELQYLFTRPTMNWLKTETFASGHNVVRATTKEHCDPASNLCFPERIEVRKDGSVQSTTTLSHIAVNEGVPAETFSPTATSTSAGMPR